MVPDMKAIGAKTTTSTSVIAMAAMPISLRPLIAASLRLLAQLEVAEDVLQHHDRVVDQHADHQHQRHQAMTFRVKPRISIARKVVISDVGIAHSTIIVLRKVCRKTAAPAR